VLTLVGCPLPEETLAVWSRLLVADVEPYFLIEGDYHMLPSDADPVPRADFTLPGEDEGLRDSYRFWAVDRKASWVWAVSPERRQRLSGKFQHRLNLRQWELGRGNIYDIDWVERCVEPFTETIAMGWSNIETPDGWKILLRSDYWWDVLPERGRWAWLAQIVQDEALADCQSSRLDLLDWQRLEGRFPAIRTLAGTFVARSGPNCFSTTLALLGEPSQAAETASRWLIQPELLEALNGLGYRAEPVQGDVQGRDLAPGTVVGWTDSAGTLQHAFTYLGEGLVLNKQSQCWWHPRQIVPFRVAWESWAADGLSPLLFLK
jgi:hypothetical protein